MKHLEGILICGDTLLAERFLYKNANVSSVTEAVPLHDAMTPKITQRVRICALKLQDQNVIAKLCPGDLVAQEAKYHSQCLVKLYNASSRKTEEGKHEYTEGVSHAKWHASCRLKCCASCVARIVQTSQVWDE